MLPCAAVCRGLEENMGPIAEFAVVIFEYTQATEKEGLCKLFAIVVVVFVRLCFSPRASLCTIPNGNIDSIVYYMFRKYEQDIQRRGLTKLK